MKDKNQPDLAQADALMGVFGLSRVSSDRDLLKMAAKAAGYWSYEFNCADNLPRINWNPLDDDGDALRLAVALKLEVMFFLGFGEVHASHTNMDFAASDEPLGNDDYSATRRAIVRAAAAIGESQ